MNNDAICIILVDDNKLVREAWKELLENNPRFRIIADCENGDTAIKLAHQHCPDIMLVDINMSPLNGFAVTEKIGQTMSSVKIIGLSANNHPMYATRMMELGAKGYLTKTSPLDEINLGILEVYKGNFYICEEIKRRMPEDR
jgi:DNA-binding NarL/FixJ family response regulator